LAAFICILKLLYLRDGIKGRVKIWKQNGWVTKDGTEVKHRDLWVKLDALAQSHKLKLSSIDTRDPHMKVLSDNLKQTAAALWDD